MLWKTLYKRKLACVAQLPMTELYLNPVLISFYRYAVFDREVDLERIGSIYEFGFPSYIKKVDAALIYGPYKNTYFFTGKYYWRYNERKRRMDPGYPKEIRPIWKGVPANVDSAVTWKNQVSYFFKGNLFLNFECFNLLKDCNRLIDLTGHYLVVM